MSPRLNALCNAAAYRVRAWLKTKGCPISAAFLAVGLAGFISPEVGAVQHYERPQCIGCHTGASRGALMPETGEMKDVAIHMDRFEQGVHGEVDCETCHERGFTTFPHSNKRTLTCAGCHPREKPEEWDLEISEREKSFDFREWTDQFKDTVHFTEYGADRDYTEHKEDAFGCEQCHEPHYFQVMEDMKSILEAVDTHNQWCVRCHSGEAEKTLAPLYDPRVLIGGETMPGRTPGQLAEGGEVDSGAESEKSLADPAEPNLVAEHSYLPHARIHLTRTRCIECHTSNDDAVSHELLVEGASQGCVACHKVDSILLKTLYRHRQEVAAPVSGFTNPRLLTHSYIMGSTLYRAIDWFAVALGVAILLFIAVQATMRLRRRRRGRNREHP